MRHLGLVGVALDLAAQPHHAQVDAAVEHVPAAVVRLLHDLVAVQRPVGVAREQRQQVELGGGDLDLAAVWPQAALSRSSSQAPKRTRWLPPGGAAAAGAAPGTALRAAQHRAHARQQFTQLEGLGHVVVGAQFQPDDAVDGSPAVVSMIRPTCGCASRSQRASDRPFSPGMLTSRMARSGATPPAGCAPRRRRRRSDGATVAAEVLGQQAAQFGFVVHHQQRGQRSGLDGRQGQGGVQGRVSIVSAPGLGT
jgi:hypothetical protein